MCRVIPSTSSSSWCEFLCAAWVGVAASSHGSIRWMWLSSIVCVFEKKIENHWAGSFSKENQKSYNIKKEKEKKSFDDIINRQQGSLFQIFLEWNTWKAIRRELDFRWLEAVCCLWAHSVKCDFIKIPKGTMLCIETLTYETNIQT